MDNKKIEEKIKKIRKKREQTQAEFADELNIDLSYLGQLERGKNWDFNLWYECRKCIILFLEINNK